MLAIDLGVVNRKAHVVSVREALAFTTILVLLALAFTVLIWASYDRHWLGLGTHIDRIDGALNDGRLAAVKFITGYLVELSLSADNVFVMAMIFAHLRIPAQYQHRVLFWGILGALIMRGIMIVVGTQLIARYHWILYVFGAFLVVTGIKMIIFAEAEPDLEKNPLLRWLRGHLRITPTFHGEKFFVRKDGLLWATPMFLVLVLIEASDLVFAVDSIPAIFAVTTDPFIVFTSNIFAIMGLRALYFLLADMADRFHLLKYGLAIVLVFIGGKMLAMPWFHVPIQWSLSIVASIIGSQGFAQFKALGIFVLCVLLALAIQAVYYLVRIRFGSWVSPVQLLRGGRDALVMAFSTASASPKGTWTKPGVNDSEIIPR